MLGGHKRWGKGTSKGDTLDPHIRHTLVLPTEFAEKRNIGMNYYNPRWKNLSVTKSAQLSSISIFMCMWAWCVGEREGAYEVNSMQKKKLLN